LHESVKPYIIDSGRKDDNKIMGCGAKTITPWASQERMKCTMTQLTKEQSGNIAKLIDELTLAGKKIEIAVSTYNQDVEKLRAPVEIAVTEYNEIVSEARTLCSDVANKITSYISDKSEKWQESDKGQAVQEFADAWEGVDLSDIDYAWPDELIIEIPTYDSDLEELPQEAEGV
jgi:hypothetical protein